MPHGTLKLTFPSGRQKMTALDLLYELVYSVKPEVEKDPEQLEIAVD